MLLSIPAEYDNVPDFVILDCIIFYEIMNMHILMGLHRRPWSIETNYEKLIANLLHVYTQTFTFMLVYQKRNNKEE